jgi:hypothetical protein
MYLDSRPCVYADSLPVRPCGHDEFPVTLAHRIQSVTPAQLHQDLLNLEKEDHKDVEEHLITETTVIDV